jgi:hypothetical protein
MLPPLSSRRSPADQSFASSNAQCEGYSIVVGTNPALQKQFFLSPKTPQLIPGNVHRASQVQEGIGGKGQDVAVTLGCLTSSSSSLTTSESHSRLRRRPFVLLAQFLGKGATGDLALSKLKKALHEDECLNDDDDDKSKGPCNMVDALTVRINSSLRTCTTIIGEDSATELVEPSGTVHDEEIEQLYQRIEHTIHARRVRGLCIMGSMPPGCPKDLYANIYEKVTNVHPYAITLIDSVVGLDHLFEKIARKKSDGNDLSLLGKTMLKLNFAEICSLARIKVDSETSCIDPNQVINAVNEFLSTVANAQEALDYIAITNSSNPAYFFCISGERSQNAKNGGVITSMFQLNVPNVSFLQPGGDVTVYPIGAGDLVAAGTLAAWEYLSMPNPSDTTLERLSSCVQKEIDLKLGKDYDDAGLISFAFGIACGSASCIQRDNSMLDVDHALELFTKVNLIPCNMLLDG